MATNFPEIWSDRFIQNLNNAAVAPWLDGIPELNAQVSEINGGSLSEKNTIHVAATDFEVDILVNNTTYPIDVQTYTDGTLSFNLDKFQTKVVSLNDDDVIGASYDKIDTVTRTMKDGILAERYKKAIHAIAPAQHAAKTPVIKTTGGPDKLKDASGRLRLTYEDLVELKNACKGFGVRRLVLCETHFNDLLLDRKNFGDKLVNYNAGEVAPVIAGFKIYQWDDENMPVYDTDDKKKAYGAVPAGTDNTASVVFGETAIAKKTGLTKQYYTPSATNPRGQTNDLAYRHYFMALPFRAEKVGAIISGSES